MSLCSPIPRAAMAAALLAAWPALAFAQSGSGTGSDEGRRQPPKLTLGFEAGFTMPTLAYDERVEGDLRFPSGDTIGSERFTTRWTERLQVAPMFRATLRYRPAALLGFYLALQHSQGPSESVYSGGAATDTMTRQVRIQSAELGLHMQLSSWAGGNGFLDYTLGVALVHNTLDLSAGHRNRFAEWRGQALPANLEWSQRTWTSISFAGGLGVRFPVGENLALRLGANGYVVPVNTSQIALQESREIGRFMHPPPNFSLSSYTAIYGAARVGVEYVLSRERARGMPTIALPQPERIREFSPESLAAQRMAADGDTASAIAAFREVIASDAEDHGAWRFLALILSDLAAADTAYFDEAWTTIQRAIRLNPADNDLLAAFGRTRSLMHRAGAARQDSPPLAMSGVSARGDAGGAVSLAWGVQNLGQAGYRVRIEVISADGERVPIRLAGQAGASPEPILYLEREAPAEGAATERVELRMLVPRPGPYSVRVQVRDAASGETVERSSGFEIR